MNYYLNFKQAESAIVWLDGKDKSLFSRVNESTID